jgi:Icc-related predicted phosphoesterase
VLVSHQPPSPWVEHGRDLGSPALGRLLHRARFDMVIVGHIHDEAPAFRRGERGETILNPGPQGFLVTVDLAGCSMAILPREPNPAAGREAD